MVKTGKTIAFSIVVLCFFSLGLKLDEGSGYKALAGPTNIYLHDSLMLISDSSTGIHVYSIHNEQSPQFLQRIPLGGNTGIAMRENVVYANSFGRILAIKLTGNTTYEVSSVIKEDSYWHDMGYDNSGWGCASSAPSSPYSIGSGTGGSYAVFAVIDTFLYYISNSSVITMNISKADAPVKLSETVVDWSIETIYPTQRFLYLGSSNGMYILDRSSPAHPVQVGIMNHIYARDPVVVQDTVAYVTLRSGWDYWTTQDELQVLNVKKPAEPETLSTTSLPTPFGLAVSDTLLFVALGSNGYTLLDVRDPSAVTAIQSWSSPSVRDFIWLGNRLYLMGFSDVRIYDVTDPASPVLLSTIQ